MALLPKQRRFVNEYCVDENATQAYIRAGYDGAGAAQSAHAALRRPEVAAAIAERMEELTTAAGITPEWVVNQWAKIANADVNQLTRVDRVCCRHCHGCDNLYQWTEAEYLNAVNKACDGGKDAPDGMGGFGFKVTAAPAPDCPECGGIGEAVVHIGDTRKLRGAEQILYAGAEQTKGGIKIHMRDRDKAVENLARYLGMTVTRTEISGPGGGPLALAHISANDLTDDQLAAILKDNTVDADQD
jgi:phage terminase small subunit